MKYNHILYSIAAFILFLFLFLIYKTDFGGSDEPVYSSYTASIVEDGDLNVINQPYSMSPLPPVSKTYNMPDFHNHGGVIFWAPFYIYAKSIYFIAEKLNLPSLASSGPDKLIRCAMSFSTVFFGFLAALLSYLFCRVFFSNRLAIWSTLAIFFGTTFFYFTVHEVGNAQILASFLSIVSIWFCSYAVNMKRHDWVFCGLFFSICMAVKIDLWFQIFFIFAIFLELVIFKETDWKNGLYFIAGFLPGLALKTINDYIKYGTFHIGEAYLLNFRDFYFFEQLFSTYRGFIFTSPVFYICLLGLLLCVANLVRNIRNRNEKPSQDLFFFTLASYLLIKLFVLSYRYAWGGGTPGARILSTEFPVLVLLYARAFQKQKKYMGYLLVLVSILFILWNFTVISEFISKIDMDYIKGSPAVGARINALKNFLISVFQIKELGLKLIFFPPLLSAAFLVIFYIIKRFTSLSIPHAWYLKSNRQTFFKPYIVFTAYLFTAYLIVTLLNAYNNPKNVEKLKQEGFFKNVELLSPFEFEKLENAGSMDEMIAYYELKGDTERADKIKKLKENLYRK